MRVIKTDAQKQLAEIQVGCADIISEEELLKKLEKSYALDKPLRVKFGADPSCPDIHLGHTVVINKLRLLQEFGHHIIFIIGDFTARIGDPTGKSKTRPQLSEEEVQNNSKTYKEQIFKILDPLKTEVVYNSQWLDLLKPTDFIRLMASRTVQQLIAREDFSKRYAENSPIYLHEFIYPIMQAYDSIHLKADIELGGTDQTFNLLLGREMQKIHGQAPQNLLIMPLLEGLDGVMKMSKSLNNFISLTDTAKDMFGKTMSISDTHMLRFYELLSRKGQAHLQALRLGLNDQSIHPMDAKKSMAQEIVEQYWGRQVALQTRKEFDEYFSKKLIPSELLSVVIQPDKDGFINLLDLSVSCGFSKSKSEARRILQQNGMKIDDETVTGEKFSIHKGKEYIFRQGKLHIVKLLS